MLFVKYFFELSNLDKIKFMILLCQNDSADQKFLITNFLFKQCSCKHPIKNKSKKDGRDKNRSSLS